MTALPTPGGTTPRTPLVEVRDLSIHFRTGSGEVQVTNQVSFQLRAGERVGVVGESGCGNTVSWSPATF